MRISPSFWYILLIYIILMTASFFTSFLGEYVGYRSIWAIGMAMVLEWGVLTFYFVGSLLVYVIAKKYAKKKTVYILFKSIIVIGIFLLFLVFLGYMIVYFQDVESKNEFTLANKTAFEIIGKIENYNSTYGYYPSDVGSILNNENIVLKNWNYSSEEIDKIVSWQDGNYTLTYTREQNGTSYRLEFHIYGWWYSFIYDKDTNTLFPSD